MHITIPQFESLERRRLLAGNVSVVAGENFTATLTGDRKSNSIEISLEGTEGYLIKGLSCTKINGSDELVLRTPTAANLIFSLGRGNDSISFAGALNTQTVSIFTGDGNDRVKISRVSHFGDLQIATERGDDAVTVSNVVVTNDLTIDTGRDKDVIALASVQVDGNAKLNGGSGRNTLSGANQLFASGTRSIQSLNSGRSSNDDRDGDDDDDDDDDDDRGTLNKKRRGGDDD